MDEKAVDEIVKRINPQRGLDHEINRVLKNNDSLNKSATWTEPTNKQKKEILSRVTSDERIKGLKFDKRGKQYIRVDENNYRRVLPKDDVYTDRSGNVYVQDSEGFRKVVAEKNK